MTLTVGARASRPPFPARRPEVPKGARDARAPWCAPATILACAAASLLPGAAHAQPSLAWPVACTLGEDCFIQNYVDADPGPERADFTCGRLSYDEHKGTDIRLRDLPAMVQGVDVLAAAAGEVKGIRDGEPDLDVNLRGDDAIGERLAGNGVLIDHGDGWETQYSHMRLGSIAVETGQRVEAGTALGKVGLSGQTEFPHMHFEIRHDGASVDPFTGLAMAAGCEEAGTPLWATEVAYVPTGALQAGFATGPVESFYARAGTYAAVVPQRDEPLVMWADVFGVLAGDVQRVVIAAPDGSTASETETTLEDSKVIWFAFSGARPPDGGWPPGTYTGRFTLTRDGGVVAEIERAIEMP